MTDPIDPIGAVQDAMIAHLNEAFAMNPAPGEKRALREIKPLHLRPDRGADLIEQINPPSLYVLFLEVQPTQQFDTVELRWGVYATSNRATLEARTRGDDAEMGAYLIAARAARVLNGFNPPVPGASSLTFHGGQNVATEKLARKNLSVIALTFSGNATIGLDDPSADLAPFLRYHSDWDVEPHEDPAPDSIPIPDPDATNDVTLTGAADAS